MSRFLERLAEERPVVADGGMGTLISAAAGHGLRTPEEANIVAAETVVSLHLGFIQAGAELIETNTFGANRMKLEAHVLADEARRINSEAVKLAREAREISGRDVFIAGSVGPGADAEQIEALAARGVDLFMVETYAELDELLVAIELVRTLSALPIVALMTFGADGETPAGVTAEEAGRALAEVDVAAVGANHGAGPQAALTALAAMANGKPLAALPNVGLAGRWGSRIVYPHADTQYFADFAAQARDLGARIVGGCCGTTPLQIEAIRDALRDERPSREPIYSRSREPRETGVTAEHESRFAAALRAGRFTSTIEINPPKGGSDAGLLELCRSLEASGRVEFLDVTDNYTARARMNSMMASAAVERETSIEKIGRAHV